jgi:hypothetical protein
LDKAIAVVL